MDNFGKDIRTVASGVAGVGDSAKVYAVSCEIRMGVVRQVNAGYDETIGFVRDKRVKLP